MPRVGLIANPSAGKDIRRLVSQATIVTAPEKVALLRRILCGLAATQVEEILYLRDGMHLVDQALAVLGSAGRNALRALPLPVRLRHDAGDTRAAARALAEARVDAILVLGGDGTSRVVAAEIGNIPLLPISTGTNNAFPQRAEATAAGLALGMVAKGRAPGGIARRKRIELWRGGTLLDTALIDAVLLRPDAGPMQAVWDPDDVREIFVTQGVPDSVGWSAAVGAAMPVDPEDPFGAHLRLDPDASERLLAPIAPGLVEWLGVGDLRKLPVGEEVRLEGPQVLALDGEPLLRLPSGEHATLRVTFDGPRVIDVTRVLREAASTGAFRRGV